MSDDDDFLFHSSDRTMTLRKRPVVIVGVLVGLVIVVLLATTIYFASRSKESEPSPSPAPAPANQTSYLPCPLEYFNLTDGFDVRWFPAANTLQDLNSALTAGYQVVGADVTVSGVEPFINNGSLSLDHWLDTALQHKVGLKLTLTSDAAVEPTLATLRSRRPWTRPVYLAASVFTMADTNSGLLNKTRFLSKVNGLFPEARLTLGIQTGASTEGYGIGLLEAMADTTRPLKQPISVEMDAGLVLKSWSDVRPWMKQGKAFAVILTLRKSGDASNVSEYDLLLIRNDCDGDLLYYNMIGDTYDKFVKLSKTAESPMLAYNIRPRDASKILWAHAVNNHTKLSIALNGSTMMLEADILMGRETGTNNTHIPIMAHPPYNESDLTFEQFIDAVSPTKKGMKFDFKDLEAVPVALNMTDQRRANLTGPIWINADILKGPNGKNVTMHANEFLKAALDYFPETILSLGWTTGAKSGGTEEKYTMDMMTEMHTTCKSLTQPITFPVRAEMTRDSLEQFNWLLHQSRGYTLTVWTSPTDSVTKADMNYVSRHVDASRVYFDLPPDLMPDIGR